MIIESVTGGTVVRPSGLERADVIIEDGRITALVPPGRPAAGGPVNVVDAGGCYVLPGGVDPHCHAMADVAGAARAAALGGTTTILSFSNPGAGENTLSCLERRIGTVEQAGPAVDVGLHAMAGDPATLSRDELAAVRVAGASALKIFLAYPELGIMCTTGRLYELMTWAAEAGVIVQVHCENGTLIECLRRDGVGGRDGLHRFVGSRPPEVEEEAVARTIAVAALTGATAYLVHLSSGGAIGQVRLARARRRANVLAEVCLHHLVLDESVYERPDAERFLVVPPLRATGDVRALWGAVVDGTVDTVGSDHAQLRSVTADDPGRAAGGYSYGLAGAGARLPVMLSEGLARGVPLTRLVELLSSGPARAFGHYPTKGVIAPGSDADLAVFDPAGETIITPESFDDGTGDSVYSGKRLRGRLRAVLLRGHLVAAGGELVGAHPGEGRYLPAPARPALLPPTPA